MHIQYTHTHQGGELFRHSVLFMFYLPNLPEIIRSILGTHHHCNSVSVFLFLFSFVYVGGGV